MKLKDAQKLCPAIAEINDHACVEDFLQELNKIFPKFTWWRDDSLPSGWILVQKTDDLSDRPGRH